jgi:TRAP transporter TAXI family solute receptor
MSFAVNLRRKGEFPGYCSYHGVVLFKKSFKNTRLLIVGGALQLGFYVPKDSPIKTIHDLKGKKIPAEFPGTPIVWLSISAALASAGITHDDIVKVPVSDLVAGNRAFMEGRTDAGWFAVRSPAVKEADARKRGIRFLSVVDTPEGAKKMAEIYPGSYPSVMKKGSSTGILEDTVILTNDIYLVASKDLSDEGAYEIVKALWVHNKELGEAYRGLRAWHPGRMVSQKAYIPYHPGAIRFFKEKGKWDEKMDALQSSNLAK